MTAERITSVRMSAFRGIPETFEVDFDEGKSLVLLGPNATGKSTIADAVEWHFSGGIELLQHEGRQADIRHRGAANETPTSVRIDTIGDLGGETWADPDLGDAPSAKASGETFLLRGSTLQRFVNLTKAKKWDELSHLLGLEEVDALRKDLLTASNALARLQQTSAEQLASAVEFLTPICTVDDDAGLWSEIQAASELTGIEIPSSLDAALDSDWTGARPAAQDLAVSERLASQLSTAPPLDVDVAEWNAAVGVLATDTAKEIALLIAAQTLIESSERLEICPLCRQAVDGDDLRESVGDRLRNLREEALAQQVAKGTLAEVARQVAAVGDSRRDINESAKDAGIDLPEFPESDLQTLLSLLDSGQIASTENVQSVRQKIVQWDTDAQGALGVAGASESTSASPVVTLVRLVERGRSWRQARTASARDEAAAVHASEIHEVCSRMATELFDDTLSAISQPLDEIYSRLHPGESLSEAAVETVGNRGLELSVTFHGEICCPPHGVLSESHLNSLGIAVFLAMAETFNERVRFLVLDDVVSSFDIEHREDLAILLVERYEDWQLILLTHDHRFFERIRREAPSWIALQLTSWDFSTGPRFMGYLSTDLVARARARFEGGDAPDAARGARRALEEFLQEWCEGVGAPVPFRRGFKNDRREAQELINGIRRTADKLDGVTKAAVKAILAGLETDLQVTLNSEAHASQDWASDGEVEGAIARIEDAVAQLTCSSCSTRVWRQWTGTSGTCRCGELHIPPGRDAAS